MGAIEKLSTANAAQTNVVSVDWSTFVPMTEGEPQRGLFDVEVFGFDRIDLVPRNELARAILHCLLHGRVTPALTYRGMADAQKYRAERATLSISYPPALSKKESSNPFGHQQRLNGEQVEKIEKALTPALPKPSRPKAKGKKNAAA